MSWKCIGTLRQSIDNFSVNANVNNLLYFFMVVPILQCYDFKQALYSITLKSHLAILLNNLTENGVFLAVRVLAAALLRQSKSSTAPYHAALGYLLGMNGLFCNGVGQRPKGHCAAAGEKQDLCCP